MTLHIYRARDQPATRFSYVLDLPGGPKTCWIVNRRRTLLPCFTCKRRRRACNLTAHVYYDATYFFCKQGKGCKMKKPRVNRAKRWR
jgi:hypothetical protein